MHEPSGLLIFTILFIVIGGFVGFIALVGTLADRREAARRPPTSARLRGQRARVIRSAKPPARATAAPAAPHQAETTPQPRETHFAPVSGTLTPQTDAETVAFHCLAKLIRAGMLTETQALEGSFEVKAGSSKAYQEKRARLKAALADLEAREAEARQAEARQAAPVA